MPITSAQRAHEMSLSADIVPTQLTDGVIRVIGTVFGIPNPEESMMYDALDYARLYSQRAILTTTDDILNGLQYRLEDEDTGDLTDVPLDKQYIAMLHQLRAYYRYISDQNYIPPTFERIDPADFKVFIDSDHLGFYLGILPTELYNAKVQIKVAEHMRYSQPNPPRTPSSVPSAANTSQGSGSSGHGMTSALLLNWQKSIKRDQSVFDKFTRDDRYIPWREHLETQLPAQGLEEVIDPDYSPSTPDEKDLFKCKQDWMYSTLVNIVKTDKGKEIVLNHKKTRDARKVLAELASHYVKDTNRTFSVDEIRTFLQTVKFGPHYPGTAMSFLSLWKNQARIFNEIVDKDQRYNDAVLTDLLKSAVSLVKEFRQAQTTSDVMTQFASKNANTTEEARLSYPEYCNLLTRVALRYDKDRSLKSQRKVLYAGMYDDADTDYFPPDVATESYDFDTPISTILAHQALVFQPALSAYASHQRDRSQSRGRRNFSSPTRLPDTQWQALTPEMRAVWSSLDDHSKAVILGKTPSSSHGKPPPRRTTNLHDISAHDFMQLQAHFHETPTEFWGSETSNPQPAFSVNQHQLSQLLDEFDSAHHGEPPVQVHQTEVQETTPDDLPISSPADLRRVFSQHFARKQDTSNPKSTSTSKYKANKCNIIYRVQNYTVEDDKKLPSLVDRGANGGIGGQDVRVIEMSGRRVDVQGIDQHQINDIPICTVGGVVTTSDGEQVIAVFGEYAWTGNGPSIHSSGQLEYNRISVDDRSAKVGGKQCLKTDCGRILPLKFRNGLARLPIRPYTDHELETLPQVIMSMPGKVWDPSVLDSSPREEKKLQYEYDREPGFDTSGDFDEYGELRYQVVANAEHFFATPPDPAESDDPVELFDQLVDLCVYHTEAKHSGRHVKTKDPPYGEMQRNFLFRSPENIKKTFEHTTQFARIPHADVMKKHYKSPNPALNIPRRNEDLTTDTFFSDVPAINGGEKVGQYFQGTTTKVRAVYGLKSEKQFLSALQDEIRKRGAPNRLITDRAKVETSEQTKRFLRSIIVGDWQSEPHQQHQNPAERGYQDVKNLTQVIMDRFGVPPELWLLVMKYVCFILNHSWNEVIKGIPLERLHGSTVDISPILRFHFWQPVYVKVDDAKFPSESREIRGRMVGFAENIGHAMTFLVLTDDTRQIIARSNIRPADIDRSRNLRVDPIDGEKSPPPFIKSIHDFGSLGRPPESSSDVDSPTRKASGEPHNPHTTPQNSLNADPTQDDPMPKLFPPGDLVGRTFLMDEQDDGQRFRARIIEAIVDHDKQTQETDAYKQKFLVKYDHDKREEILAYNDIARHLNSDFKNETKVWKFKDIISHEGPLEPDHPNYRGSKWNIMIEWENGEKTS